MLTHVGIRKMGIQRPCIHFHDNFRECTFSNSQHLHLSGPVVDPPSTVAQAGAFRELFGVTKPGGRSQDELLEDEEDEEPDPFLVFFSCLSGLTSLAGHIEIHLDTWSLGTVAKRDTS